jgi:hypothetical protein
MSITPLHREQVSAEFGFSVRQCGQSAMEASTIRPCSLVRSNYPVWGLRLQLADHRLDSISIAEWVVQTESSPDLSTTLIVVSAMAFST